MRRTTVAQGGRADAVLAAVLTAVSLLALALPADRREPVAAGVRRTVGAPLLLMQERAERSRAAFMAHDSTNRLVDSLVLSSMDVVALRAENERLRGLLGLSTRLRWGFLTADAAFLPGDEHFIPAVALGERDSRQGMIAINVGSRAGVAEYAPVVAPGGLVGRVRTVDPNTSQVELYSHENFRVSAMTADQQAVGIVRPHLGQVDDENLLEMSGVQLRNQLSAGTVIYSSGLGGTVPAYIPIGTVVREIKTTGLSARTYLLRPMVRPGAIRTVLVLLPERVTAGVEGVWVSAPDSALRAILAAGDSIARDSLMADSLGRLNAIRQRLLDSLRTAGVNLTPAQADSAARANAGAAAPPPAGATARPPGAVAPPAAPRPAAPVTPRPTPRPDTASPPPPDTGRSRPGAAASARTSRRPDRAP